MGSQTASRPAAHSSLPAPPTARWAVWLATGLGAGYLPVMPGTYGSAQGVALYLALAALAAQAPYRPWLLTSCVLALVVVSLLIIAAALPHFASDDPSAIVLDEVAGQALTLLPLAFVPPRSGIPWLALAAGFLLFRTLDTLKPFPIWKLGHLKGGTGVLADDVGAGLVGAVLLFALARFGWV